MEFVRIKSYNHALITLLPFYCALIEGIVLALRTVNKGSVFFHGWANSVEAPFSILRCFSMLCNTMKDQ
jgi:hypothetical protein